MQQYTQRKNKKVDQKNIFCVVYLVGMGTIRDFLINCFLLKQPSSKPNQRKECIKYWNLSMLGM